jgi:excisionase family DNA binding protein
MVDLRQLPDVLTVDEVARYLRVSKTTICRWCSSGKLPAFRIGRGWRVNRNTLEHFTQQRPILSAFDRNPDQAHESGQ